MILIQEVLGFGAATVHARRWSQLESADGLSTFSFQSAAITNNLHPGTIMLHSFKLTRVTRDLLKQA